MIRCIVELMEKRDFEGLYQLKGSPFVQTCLPEFAELLPTAEQLDNNTFCVLALETALFRDLLQLKCRQH